MRPAELRRTMNEVMTPDGSPAGGATQSVQTPVRGTFWPLARMATTIIILHVVGIVLLLDPAWSAGHLAALGLALTAYTLGLRHAFDADHIAAIDNTTRKLIGEPAGAVSVGFWFSLGHSTVVLALTFILSLGARALAAPIADDGSTLHQVTSIVGTTVSSVFLYAIATINLFLLLAGIRTVRGRRTATAAGDSPGDLVVLGPMSRLFGRAMRSIRRPWQMYPLGVLFGLGFDTATEIGLLVIAATSAAAGIPWYDLLALPVIFAAGMSLLDTADGVAMRFAYRWALGRPARRAGYNLTVTALSVIIALVVATVELTTLIGDRLHLNGSIWDWSRRIDLNAVGFVIVAVFLLLWALAYSVSRLKRFPDRSRMRPNRRFTSIHHPDA